MKLFYGWVIVGAGIVVTCIGVGAMLSLAIFLQPMSEAMGWSRTGISTAALLNWLCMGVGSFLWGALSDRFGTRAVVLLGGGSTRSRLGDGEPGGQPRPVPARLRSDRRPGRGQLLYPDDGDDQPLVHAESQSRGRARLRGAQRRLGNHGAPRSLAYHQLRLAHRHAGDRRSRVARRHSCRLARARPAGDGARSRRGAGGRPRPPAHRPAGAPHPPRPPPPAPPPPA